MGGQRYTVEQLEHLKQSPLVQKPDGLPAIEQWMDVPADQNTNTNSNNSTRRPRSGNHGEGAIAGENRGDRPLLINSGGMGHFGRRPSQQPEDTVLGPPKLSFTSASRAAKAAENSEKRGITSIDGDHIGDRFPTRQRGERWREREVEGTRDKAGYTNGRRGAREEGEGWTSVKGRKSLGQEDFDRGFGRNGEREREKSHKDGDGDNAEGPPRRTNAGRDKFDRWSRRDETNTKEAEGTRISGPGGGGWRDRERDRDYTRDKDREWNRGSTKAEEDPEWMESGSTKEKKQAHTQEEFQRWKEQMRAKDTPAVEKEEPKADPPAAIEPPASNPLPVNPPLKTPSAEPTSGVFFGNWGRDKAVDTNTSALEGVPAKTKQVKSSRFMKMFEKPEESTPPPQPLASIPASPPPQSSADGGQDADKEGFNRILQMLGGAKSSGAPVPPPGAPTPLNGARQGGVPLDLHLQQQSPPEERPDSRAPRQPVPRTLEERNMLDNILGMRASGPESRPTQARFDAMSPDNASLEHFGRPEQNRPTDEYSIQQPPSRNTSAQDAHLHALLNSRAREETSRDPSQKQRERDFLLTLMQQPRATPPHLQNQNPPRPGPDNQGMAFFDQGPQRLPPQAKGRGGPPPGFMEDPRFINENEMMRREQQLREANMRQQQEEAMRAKNSRLPMMGFNPGHDDPNLAGLQRRNTHGEIPRQLTNMGIPSQPVPDMQVFGRNPAMPPTPQDRPNIAPPPGFGAPASMRQPPGLGGPNGPQQVPSFSAGNTPLGPPGFGPPPGSMRGMFPGGPGQNQMPPQGPPQGYFPPPGYGPPMGMRGAEDPRMMMGRPEFEQFGGPGPRQAGRPPNMY